MSRQGNGRFVRQSSTDPGAALIRGRGFVYPVALYRGAKAVYTIATRTSSHAVSITFAGGRAEAEAEDGGSRPYFETEYFGTSLHRTEGSTGFSYRNIYPGIDVRCKAEKRNLEYEFHVHPGGNPEHIRMVVAGASELLVNGDRQLIIGTGDDRLTLEAPIAWQETPSGRKGVDVQYRIDRGVIGITLGAYDPAHELIIDPVVTYSAALGGSGLDTAYATAVDGSGNIFIAGETMSSDFPLSGVAARGRDVFVMKLDSSGTTVLYSTVVGGTGEDVAYGLAVDLAGNAYVTGKTTSTNFPVTGRAIRTTAGGQEDAFVAKLNPSGQLIYSTYLGGSGSDTGYGIAVDLNTFVYVTGSTSSALFPTTSLAPQKVFRGGFSDAFLTKIDVSAGQILHSTFLGGSGVEGANAIGLEPGGGACIAGFTGSSDLPTVTPVQAALAGSTDGFLACLNAAGSQWSFLSYFGGNGPDEVTAVSIDPTGNRFLCGTTSSYNLPISNGAFQTYWSGQYDAFAAEISAAGTIVFSTYYGGSGNEVARSLIRDASGGLWISGWTNSSDLPLKRANNTYAGARDVFAARFSLDGSQLSEATYYGGGGDDAAYGMVLSPSGEIIITGQASQGFPLLSASLAANGQNAFLLRMSASASNSPPMISGWSPTGGSRAAASFTLSLTDADGGADIRNTYILIGDALDARNTCFITYPGDSMRLALMNDGGSAWLGYLTPGSAGVLSNSQCTLIGIASSVNVSGSNVTITLSLTFSASFAGTHYVYSFTEDAAGSAAGYRVVGSWTVPSLAPPQPPTPQSVTPSSQSATSASFTLKVNDANGYADIEVVYFLLNRTLTEKGGCFVSYVRRTNQLFLFSDSGGWLAPITPGGSGATVSNNQCTLSASGSTVSASGTSLTIVVALTFRPTFTGLETMFLYAADSAWSNAGYQTMGTWLLAGGSPPAVLSATPSSGSGTSQIFSVRAFDSNGYGAMQMIYLLFDSRVNGINACFIEYNPVVRTFRLMNNAATAWSNTVIAGGSGSIGNSQCSLTASGSGSSGGGNFLDVSVALTFSAGFTGQRNLYGNVVMSLSGLTSGYTQVGTWTVPAVATPHTPTPSSLSPISSQGPEQTFTVVVDDPIGAETIAFVYFLIDRTVNGNSACMVTYTVGNQLTLLNDNASAWLGPIAPGSGASAANSQCTLHAVGSSATLSGSRLTLTLHFSFSNGFSGGRNIYVYAGDTAGNTSGYRIMGSWTR